MTRTPEETTWLQALFAESPVAIAFSRDGVMLDANPTYVKLFGYEDARELRGKSLLDQVAHSERTRVAQLVAKRARGEAPPRRYETLGLRKDGTEFPFVVTLARVVVADGPLTIAFMHDVSDLQESEERFRTLSAAAFEGVFIHSEGKVLLANDAGAAMYGYDPPDAMVGVSLMDLTAPESRALVTENVRRGVTGPYEAIGLRKDGTTFIGEGRGRNLVHRGVPIRVVVIRDVTERKRAEGEQQTLGERVRHAQKLESLGVLAGGVAHDFNNILTVISNSVALAKAGQNVETHLDGIAVATSRAAELCRQMLSYAGKTAFALETVEVSTLVNEMLSMLDVSVGKKAVLVRDLAANIPMVRGDATQLRQVVLNLVLNAAEAIARPEGKVVVATGVGTYGHGALSFAKESGPYVFVEVRDDGVGMDAGTVAQMFDPFFTTKFVGRGLGMATVLGIVRGHGGAIEVESSPGKGTQVRVFFPTERVATQSTMPRAGTEVERGRGVVLVVDDEKGVRVTTSLLLEQLGFEALVASDGLEALDVLRANAGIDAVLLDLTMPRLDGIQTMKAMREISPQLPIVLTSGHGQVPESIAQPNALLAKPYTVPELLTTLRRVMSR